jgi:DUF1365 family protein
MSHFFYEGTIYHKRVSPKIHEFTYPFFLLDIDITKLDCLVTKYFSINGLNLFSFCTKDHFGSSDNFHENIEELLLKFDIEKPKSMRFITLPRILNYVFNPISILVLLNHENKPNQMLVEVKNYNGGSVVYPVVLEQESGTKYKGSVKKDMYVSPFLKREGVYKFTIDYTLAHMNISINLYEQGEKVLIASLFSTAKEYSSKNILNLFFRHTLLTIKVVTRTMWQSLRLYLKGISFNSVTPQDEIKRY